VGLLRATGAGVSSAGLGRGSGIDDVARRCGGVRGWAKWFNQVAIADSGDRASGDAAPCAWADAHANGRKITQNAAAFDTVTARLDAGDADDLRKARIDLVVRLRVGDIVDLREKGPD
jgi:hypothetical protein